MATNTYKCKCSNPINENDLETLIKSNELGEEYTVIEYSCSNCQTNIVFEEWGEVFNNEAKELINEYLKVN